MQTLQGPPLLPPRNGSTGGTRRSETTVPRPAAAGLCPRTGRRAVAFASTTPGDCSAGRYLHTEEPIPFRAFPRLAPAPNLSAVGNHDENVLHALDAFEAWTSLAACHAAAPLDATDADDTHEARA